MKQGWRHYTGNLYINQMTTWLLYETKECEEEATILEEEVRKAIKALSNGKITRLWWNTHRTSRRRSNKGVSSNMPTNLDKKGLAKTMEGVSLCTNTKKRRFQNMLKQSGNSPDIACKQSYAESHSAQIGYIYIYIYMEQEMAIEQAGFTKGRGTRDQISNLRW